MARAIPPTAPISYHFYFMLRVEYREGKAQNVANRAWPHKEIENITVKNAGYYDLNQTNRYRAKNGMSYNID